MNSEEIARLANVSRSTVSRVINRYPNVPKETRKKVQDIIDQYGYVPNSSARTLAGKTNDIIALFVADINETNSEDTWIGINSPYNAELLAEVIKSCKRRGYLVLVNTITKVEECRAMEQYFKNRMIFGGIFIGFPYKMPELEILAEDPKNNIVLIDQLLEQDLDSRKIKLLNCDNKQCGYMATQYLLELGHREIAFISGDKRLSALQRMEGYKEALREKSISIDDQLILQGFYREDISYEKTKKLFKDRKPTAIFAANDIMAMGAIRALEEMNYKVPEDISIIGVDHLKVNRWKNELSTISFPIDEMAEKAVQLLFQDPIGYSQICHPILIKNRTCRQK